MKRRTIMSLIVLAPIFARAKDENLSEKQCQAIEKRMAKLQSRLRAGYSAKQGRKYKQQMRELQERRYKSCR